MGRQRTCLLDANYAPGRFATPSPSKMMYATRTLFLVLLAQASAWQLASPVSSRSVVRRSRSPVAMDGLVDAAQHVDTAQQIFTLVAEKVDSGKAFDEISKTAGPVFDSAVKTAGPLLQSAGVEAGKAIEAAIPELQKGFEASKPVLEKTANELGPVAKQAADIVAPVLQQARSYRCSTGGWLVVAPALPQAHRYRGVRCCAEGWLGCRIRRASTDAARSGG